MSKIILLSCVSQKKNVKCKAKDLYVSPLFCKAYKYAQKLNPDKIYILSAKHHLLELDDEIEPYNLTLNDMSEVEKKEWSQMVLAEMRRKCDLDGDEFIFLAGSNYRKYLLPSIKNYKIPMEGLGIGRQLEWLTTQISMMESPLL